MVRHEFLPPLDNTIVDRAVFDPSVKVPWRTKYLDCSKPRSWLDGGFVTDLVPREPLDDGFGMSAFSDHQVYFGVGDLRYVEKGEGLEVWASPAERVVLLVWPCKQAHKPLETRWFRGNFECARRRKPVEHVAQPAHVSIVKGRDDSDWRRGVIQPKGQRRLTNYIHWIDVFERNIRHENTLRIPNGHPEENVLEVNCDAIGGRDTVREEGHEVVG